MSRTRVAASASPGSSAPSVTRVPTGTRSPPRAVKDVSFVVVVVMILLSDKCEASLAVNIYESHDKLDEGD